MTGTGSKSRPWAGIREVQLQGGQREEIFVAIKLSRVSIMAVITRLFVSKLTQPHTLKAWILSYVNLTLIKMS